MLEALTAFFLESTFLGIWIFGWDKLSEKAHCICIWIVAFASNLSAFWILVANSFMQHPVGYALNNGRAEMTDFFALVTNHYVLGEYSHTLFSAIATAGFLVLAISAWKVLHDEVSRQAFTQTLKAGAIYMLIGLFATMGSGHMHAQYLAQANPLKLSSVEALWETVDPAPLPSSPISTKKTIGTIWSLLFPVSSPSCYTIRRRVPSKASISCSRNTQPTMGPVSIVRT